MDKRKDRLSELSKVSRFSAFDEELVKMLKDETENMPKWKKREAEKFQKKLAKQYSAKMTQLQRVSAGLSGDKILREMALEYTNRYATGGIEIQPTHFQFFEPFLHIKLLSKCAPYTEVEKENHHLFHLRDFLGYINSEDAKDVTTQYFESIPQDEVYHFNVNGVVDEITFYSSDKREIVVASFSMIRRGSSIHWYMVGGGKVDAKEWELSEEQQLDWSNVQTYDPRKKKMLESYLGKNGSVSGQRVSLDGVKDAHRTCVCGEYDLMEKVHINRCQLVEFETSFSSHTDALEVLRTLPQKEQESWLEASKKRFDQYSVLWSLAESFFQLPEYLSTSLAINKIDIKKYGKRVSKKKGGSGKSVQYEVIPTFNTNSLLPTSSIEEMRLPQFEVSDLGHWGYLDVGEIGKDRHGNSISGKNWIHSSSKSASSKNGKCVVYVKDTLESAYRKISEILDYIDKADFDEKPISGKSQIYIMRCPIMKGNIYKVGFTTLDAKERARQLSSQTSSAQGFIVEKNWEVIDAHKIETDLHMKLAPYRVENGREFFEIKLEVLIRLIESEIEV